MLFLGGQTFKLLNVEIPAHQEIDPYHNKPCKKPQAGLIHLVLEAQDGDETLLSWAISNGMRKAGNIIFYKDDSQTKFQEVMFADCYCIKYDEEFDHNDTEPLKISLTLSAGNLKGHQDISWFTNHWGKATIGSIALSEFTKAIGQSAPANTKRQRKTGEDRWRQEANKEYTLQSPSEKTSYTYQTDEQGRIKSVEGVLQLDKAERNDNDKKNVGKGDGRKAGDAGGHLIGSQFGGVGTRENLVAMNHAKVNAYPNGEFGKLEKKWADELNKVPPSDVKVKIEAIYNADNNTARPDKFKVYYEINGKKYKETIINY